MSLDNRERVLEVVDRLVEELESGERWENGTLPRFLESFGALLRSIENAYLNADQPVPDDPWVLVAVALEGARTYE